VSERIDIYKKKALNTLRVLNYLLNNLKLEKTIYFTYRQGCSEALQEPRSFIKEDWRRIKFEILCFAVSTCLLNVGPIYFADKKEEFSIYNAALQDHLYKYLRQKKITKTREFIIKEITPILKYGYGEYLNPYNRISEYARRESDESYIKLFTMKMATTIDPDNYPIGEIVTGSFLELILNVVKGALDSVFQE